jgi:uncharacterized protein YhfF
MRKCSVVPLFQPACEIADVNQPLIETAGLFESEFGRVHEAQLTLEGDAPDIAMWQPHHEEAP